MNAVDCEDVLNFLQTALITIIAGKIYVRSKASFRRWWVKPHLTQEMREKYGAYHTLFRYFAINDHEEFSEFTRMTVDQFKEFYRMVKPHLTSSATIGRGRKPLSPELQLAAVLHLLAHGNSARVNALFFRIGKSTMYKLIPQVCQAIIMGLQPVYMKFPSSLEWEIIANNFWHHLQLPNCLGAIDGKHVRIQSPPNSGVQFFNYKKYYSMVLMGTSDPFCRFTWMNFGDLGHLNDAGIFNLTDLRAGIEGGTLNLALQKELPGTHVKLPHFFIGDGGFGLRKYLITPFTRLTGLNYVQKIFNYRLSRARRIVECAFGILTQKWRILYTPMDYKLETTDNIVQALICIHNYLITSELELNEEDKRYRLQEDLEEEEEEEEDILDQDTDGISIRNTLADYFVSRPGSVNWQWRNAFM